MLSSVADLVYMWYPSCVRCVVPFRSSHHQRYMLQHLTVCLCVGGGVDVRLVLTDDDVTTGPHLGADDECAAALRPFSLSQLPHGCFWSACPCPRLAQQYFLSCCKALPANFPTLKAQNSNFKGIVWHFGDIQATYTYHFHVRTVNTMLKHKDWNVAFYVLEALLVSWWLCNFYTVWVQEMRHDVFIR